MQKTSKLLFAIICVAFVFIRMTRPVQAGNSSIFTVSAWVKPETSVASKAIVGKAEELRVATNASGNPLCQFKSTSWQTAVVSSTAISINSWSHVACTYDKTNIKIYVNGVGVGSSAMTASPDDTANALKYGVDDSASTSYSAFKGTIDELKFYNYARTSKQIVEDMNAGHPAVGSPVGSAVGYWKFDEGYGTNANNSGFGGSTLNGSLGTGSSAPTWSNDGKFGKALSFDGSNDYVDLGNQSTLDITGTNLSVSAWVNRTVSTKYMIPMTRRNVSNCLQYQLTWVKSNEGAGNDNKVRLDLRLGGGIVSFNSNTSLTDTNTWHYIVTTYNGSIVNIYIDGKLDRSMAETRSIQTCSANNSIGQDNLGGGANWSQGLIDEVKIYNYALTEDEIKLDYNKGSAMVLGSLSDTSGLTGGSVASQSASAQYCIPGDSGTCSTPVAEWSFEEGQGGTTQDTSGNGNVGTFGATTAAPSWTTGKIGKGLKFDGNNDYVDVGNGTSLNITSNFTISLWVKGLGSGINTVFVKKGWNGGFDCGVNPSYAYFRSNGLSNTDNYFAFGFTFDPTQWYHVVLTYDSAGGANNFKSYVNGVPKATLTRTGQLLTNTSNLTIGKTPLDYVWFKGFMDDVRIYNYARTPAQIAWDYNRGKPVAQYKFDECQGTVANDASGNKNNGTITIGATGTNTSAGTCTGSAGEAWKDGAIGKYNSSLEFDGTDDYVSVTHSDSLNLTSALSVAAWVNLDEIANRGIVEKTVGDAVNTQYLFFTESSRFKFRLKKGGLTTIQSNSTISSDNWYHVIGTWDGSTMKMYIDGVLQSNTASVTAPIDSGTGKTFIGTLGSGVYRMNGQIDDVKIFNYALTAQQVKQLYNAGAAVQFAPVTGTP